jgi:uncharacterized protein (DUF1330 family)
MSTTKSQVPAYSITEVEVVDADGFKRYRELSQPAVAQYGGRFLVQGAKPIVAEGDWPPQQNVVVIEFASMDQLKAWYDSPQYRAARAVARTALRRRLLFVEGVAAS